MPITIAVSGAGSLFGQGTIKSLKLGTLEFRLIALDFFPYAVGLYWADKAYLLPDVVKPEITEQHYLERMIDILNKEKVDILFPGTEFELAILSKNRKLIESETRAKVVVCSPGVIEIADDKWNTYQFLRKHNFAYPPSTIDMSTIDNFVDEVGFPLIVKPRRGFRSRGVTLVENSDTLYAAIKLAGTNPIVQKSIGSMNEEYTCGAVVIDNECLGAITVRRDLRDGNTFRAYLEPNESLENAVREMALALQPHGSVNFQLRLENGIPIVFEINARLSGTSVMRAMAGFNEADAIVRHIVLGEKIKLKQQKSGVCLRHWEEILVPWEDYNKLYTTLES